MPASGDELAFAGPAAIAASVRSRELSPREVVEHFLRRIERFDPRLGAFRVTLSDAALAAADALGGVLSDAAEPVALPLAGVPVAIKDDMPLAGQAATRGSRSPARAAATDAEAVARLRSAGAIPIGVTRVPELTIWPWTATDAGGVTRNPWDLSRTPGGSSGGSAAAVAAGLVPAATASDGAGSIRIPAACCGLVGMKPTRGLVPTLPEIEGWLGLTVFGALARTTADSALLLDVMAGRASDRRRDRTRGPCSAAAASEPGRLRVAVSRRVPPGLVASLSADQRLAFERTARLVAELGHDVVERDPEYGLAALELTQTYLRGIAEDFERLADPAATERATRQMAGAGRLLVPPRRRDALRSRRGATSARILSLWAAHDILLTPGLAETALPAEGWHGRSAPLAFFHAARFTPWTPIFNLTGQPAIAIPAGFGADGLPLSVQLVGPPDGEALLYALAAQLEAAQPWAPLTPSLTSAPWADAA